SSTTSNITIVLLLSEKVLLSDNEIRISNNYDDKLLKIWQTTISSRKTIFQDYNINDTDNILLNTSIIPSDNKLTTNNNLIIQNHYIGIEKFSIGLNKEQMKAYFLVCDHHRRNVPNAIDKLSHLLLYLTGAEGTGKTKVIKSIISYFEYMSQHHTIIILVSTGIAAALISGYTIYSAYGFGFEDYVTRNDIRVQLNYDTTIENAQKQNRLLIYSCAEDTYCQHPLKGNIRKKFLSVSDTRENVLSGILPLFIRMKIILTVNICIGDNLANARSYENLYLNHVPIYPVKRACLYTIWKLDGTKSQCQFQRFQLPLTLAYAFTDYKCQGRTLDKAVIDLSNANTYNSTYVILSRICRLNDLLFLHPFDESLLNMNLPPTLSAEIKYLEECAKLTTKLEKWPDEYCDQNDTV
ncbi:10214_t:CDS:2, partial [Scutellospora calospora]